MTEKGKIVRTGIFEQVQKTMYINKMNDIQRKGKNDSRVIDTLGLNLTCLQISEDDFSQQRSVTSYVFTGMIAHTHALGSEL